MVEKTNPVEEARIRGRAAAQHLDASLRQTESSEREIRLAELAWRPRESGAATAEADRRVVQLQARISELNAYVHAVHESRPWRVVQRMRRLLGRAW